ncbi:Myb-like DNA-binding domain containing protein [Histomonas meleagridis]|uniref:Myb-like DNA-binding domain containing protein n=1 Tax=Histomonas meleagridis TaxID=135588 RepID=UPI0035597BF1|nr:Myb-like DNA-binding domain containing protein [Histomonas meleagridis]KAH0802103.1 Myb-like DNA-binding domain containing protein [Histomonas meleagridis]
MASNFAYPEMLVDLGISYIEGFVTSLSQEETTKLRQAFEDYLFEKISYRECQQILNNIVGRDDALARIRDIINIPDEPLPYHEENDLDDSISLRKKTRTWTSQEDQRLLAAVARFGLDNWQAIAQFLGNGRNRAQCSQRWTRGLNPKISKKNWDSTEDAKLINLVKQYGDKAWTKIAGVMGNRSDVQCRYRYKQLTYDENDQNFVPHTISQSKSFHWKQSPTQRYTNNKPYNYMQLKSRGFSSEPTAVGGPPEKLFDTFPLLPINMGIPPLVKKTVPEKQDPIILQNLPGQKIKWGPCGNDQQRLDAFLSHFK